MYGKRKNRCLHSMGAAKQRIEGFCGGFEATRHSGHMPTARRWREKYEGCNESEAEQRGGLATRTECPSHKTIGAEGGRRSEILAIPVGVSMRKSGYRKISMPLHFQRYLPELSALLLHALQDTAAEVRIVLLDSESIPTPDPAARKCDFAVG